MCFCVHPLRINPLPRFIFRSHCFITLLYNSSLCTCFVSFFWFNLEREGENQKKVKDKRKLQYWTLAPPTVPFLYCIAVWKLILNADGTQNSNIYDIRSEFDACIGMHTGVFFWWWRWIDGIRFCFGAVNGHFLLIWHRRKWFLAAEDWLGLEFQQW